MVLYCLFNVILQDVVAQADETPTTLYVSGCLFSMTSGMCYSVTIPVSLPYPSLPPPASLLLSLLLFRTLPLLQLPLLFSSALPPPPLPPPLHFLFPSTSSSSSFHPLLLPLLSLLFLLLPLPPPPFSSSFFSPTQFEGGLKVTSSVIEGIFCLAARVKDSPAITGVSPSVPIISGKAIAALFVAARCDLSPSLTKLVLMLLRSLVR